MSRGYSTRVFVVDDRVTNRNILTRLAKSVEEGLQVASFATPTAALDAAREQPPDLVITDYSMPGMDGAQFIAAFRNLDGCADLPIVVITVYEERDYCYRALDAGATDFLLSPVDHMEFRARARNLLTLHRQRTILERRAQSLEYTLPSANGAAAAPWQMLIEEAPNPIAVTDINGVDRFANRIYRETFGAGPGPGLSEAERQVGQIKEDLLNAKVFDTAQGIDGIERDLLTASGERRRFLLNKAPVIDGNGEVEAVLTIALDITGREITPANGAVDDRRDRLTNLPNRELLLDRLGQEATRAKRSGELSALVILDLDRFKGVNDLHGSETGNSLLQHVAGKLAATLRDTDTLARLDGDAFAVLAPAIKRPDDAVELVHRLREVFGEPFLIDDHEIHSSASFGIALLPQDGIEGHQLIGNAELAMFQAKQAGRDGYRFFAEEMNYSARRLMALERDLRDALAREQFVVYFQPQLSLDSRKIVGVEALVRWQHPDRGLVLPGEFIQSTEELGLIGALSTFVLRSSCRHMRGWQERHAVDFQFAVNVSPAQFRTPGTELAVERVLREEGIQPNALEIELTENMVIENSEVALNSLHHLHSLGVALALDDFGTGYASLSHVRSLPVRRLKVDQSFVHNIETDSDDRAIVKSIVELCHNLRLDVVAEGVETRGQLELLRKMGCDVIQGELIGPPVPAEEFERRFLAPGSLRGLATG
ncbi:MAG: EAL domain-containing protein [Geminicoccaceae bacterium]